MTNSGSATDPEMTNANLIDIDLPTPDESHPFMDILNSDINANHDDDDAMKNALEFWEKLIFKMALIGWCEKPRPGFHYEYRRSEFETEQQSQYLAVVDRGRTRDDVDNSSQFGSGADTDSDVLLAICWMGLRMPQTEDLYS